MKIKIFLIAIAWSLAVLLSPEVQAKPCECKDLEKIKSEINRTRKSMDVWKEIFGWARGTLEGVKPPATNDELNAKFSQLYNALPSEWRRILAEPAGKPAVQQNVGGLDQNGDVIVNEEFTQANCDGIVEGVRVHERTHARKYTSPLTALGPWNLVRIRAESEVEAYRAQTIYLDALVAALELKCDGELEYRADITLNMQPLIMTKIVSTANISFKIDQNGRITGSGIQTLSSEQVGSGACTVTSVRTEYEWIVTGQEENGFLQFKFSPRSGTTIPGIQMQCKIAGGQGYGMTLPTNFSIGDIRMEKKDGATREMDMSRVSGGRATGKAVTTLRLYKN